MRSQPNCLGGLPVFSQLSESLSGDAFRRASTILLHAYRSVTKPTASDSTSSVIQSQAYCGVTTNALDGWLESMHAARRIDIFLQ
ncbi:hypothetical protein PAXRUDRAFT_825261 [Paxillus rubicundulus Ve08.2h10]|uniref:Uncharacterized protein n=1 Tax=Paxillus rubicundulus Ve08.2h10 TaxID=930991 RepID=A0A0D0DTF3_9AGAM|nr:hypothetical protein PAXRUDRAFT_825261 [Paxillus rubicundulus Ve08.2h10]